MPRLKYHKAGVRVHIWLLERHWKIWTELENKSNFVQICLDNATDIMAWAILKDIDPKKYHINHPKSEEQIMQEFNEKNPLNPLTAKRLNKEWQTPSPKLPDVLL